MNLKFISIALAIIVAAYSSKAQQAVSTGYWTWIKGADTINVKGKYGTKGVPAATNDAGGRSDAGYWKDSTGNFYVFSGRGNGANSIIAGYLNDLWKYSPATNEWTWLKGDSTTNIPGTYGNKGVSAPANNPSCRYRFPTWTDKEGNFWLFGGYGAASSLPTRSYLNDLWKYSPATNEWTWVSGQNIGNINGAYGTMGLPSSGNLPGAREGSAGWIDTNGNFWIFGGSGYGNTHNKTGVLSDLWKYDPAGDVWTWIAGDSSINATGIYGTKGTGAATNKPAARKYSASWIDKDGNLWLFGGSRDGSNQYLNDLWKYEIAKNEWTWVSGDSALNGIATYGTLYTPGETNTPSARMGAGAWTETDGHYLWLMNGSGVGAQGTGYLNDLWLFNTQTSKWTWVSGDSITNQNGVYGTQGIGDPNNRVNSRYYSAGRWSDGKGKIWVYGGHARGAKGNTFGYLNDIWKLDVCFLMAQIEAFEGADSLCRNTTATYRFPAVEHAESYIWSLPSGWEGSSANEEINITAGTEGGIISVKAINYCDTITFEKEVFVANIQAIIRVNEFDLSTSEPYTTYQWYFNGEKIEGATERVYTVPENGDYTVVVTDERGCLDTSDVYKVTNVPVSISNKAYAQQIRVYPNPSKDLIHIASPVNVKIILSSVDGKKIIEQPYATSGIPVQHLAEGIYLLQVLDEQGTLLKTEKWIKASH